MASKLTFLRGNRLIFEILKLIHFLVERHAENEVPPSNLIPGVIGLTSNFRKLLLANYLILKCSADAVIVDEMILGYSRLCLDNMPCRQESPCAS